MQEFIATPIEIKQKMCTSSVKTLPAQQYKLLD